MIKNLQIKKGVASVSLATILCSITLSGCIKKMDCKRVDEHAHLYTTEDQKFKTYRSSELNILPTSADNNVKNIYWTSKVVPLTEEIKNMKEFFLFKIEDNLDTLKEKEKKDKKKIHQEYQYSDYKYRYKYKYGQYVSVFDYTTNPNHKNLTGMVRDVFYQYKGYKMKKENGKIKIISSSWVDSLDKIKEEYPYFKLNDYRKKAYSAPYANTKESKTKQKIKK